MSDCRNCRHSEVAHWRGVCTHVAASGFICKCGTFRSDEREEVKTPIDSGLFYVFVSKKTDKPIAVARDLGRAAIYPDGEDGEWVKTQRIASSRLQALEDRLRGIRETMRPLLEEWHKLAKAEGRI